MAVQYHFLVAAVLAVAGVSLAAIEEDEVKHLPGLAAQPNFKHYSGYLQATGTRKLHYWFVESQNDPANDPVALWLNGGPGCSSLDGLLTEHGPFLAVEHGQGLIKNPFSWNLVANMLYLEAPAGVGFSYTEDNNVTTSDDQVALDNHAALKYFMEHFPEFKTQEFFITGESYGGIYVPTLSSLIVDDDSFNFKGFAVGNGLSNNDDNDNSALFFYYYHGLVDTSSWDKIRQHCCNGNFDGCNIVQEAKQNPACENTVNEIGEGLRDLNIYNLYAHCYNGPAVLNDTRFRIQPLDSMPLSSFSGFHGKIMEALQFLPLSRLASVPPCIDARHLTAYLRRSDVREALHIPQHVQPWDICSAEVGARYRRDYTSMKDQYLKVLETKKQRILVYNGDVDMACNFLGDQWFVDGLGQPAVAKRMQWHYQAHDNSTQVAGFVKHFENMSFVTVKGSGHMVPTDKPIPAFVMFRDFIRGSSRLGLDD